MEECARFPSLLRYGPFMSVGYPRERNPPPRAALIDHASTVMLLGSQFVSKGGERE